MSSVIASPKLNVDYNDGVMASAYVTAPLDVGIQVLLANGFNLISMADNARLRLNVGLGKQITEMGNFVDAWVMYSPREWQANANIGRGTHLVPKNILLDSVQVPLEAAMLKFREGPGSEFYVDDSLLSRFVQEGVSFPENSVPSKEREPGASDELVTRTIGGGNVGQAQAYLDLNRKRGGWVIHVWPYAADKVDRRVGTGKKIMVGDKEQEITVPAHALPFIRPVYFSGVGVCSLIDATRRPEAEQRVRGIRKL